MEPREAILREAARRRVPGEVFLLALDGRCASGKTTLAAELASELGCPVLHMDDFFLRPEQRTATRLAEPGGNLDRERFLDEVLRPLSSGGTFSYRPYDCRTQSLGEPVRVERADCAVIEGSYSCHPELRGYYGLTVFLSVSPEEQLRRLRARCGDEGAERFRELWIPLEEMYFTTFGAELGCDMGFDTEKSSGSSLNGWRGDHLSTTGSR